MTKVCTYCLRDGHRAHSCPLRGRAPPVEVGPEVAFGWVAPDGSLGGTVRAHILTGLAPHIPDCTGVLHRINDAGKPSDIGERWGVSCLASGARIVGDCKSMDLAINKARVRLAQKTPEQYAAAVAAVLSK